MDFRTLTIDKSARKKGKVVKTREFSVVELGCVYADEFWELGESEKTYRPVWIAYAGSEQEARAFTANLRGRRKVLCRPYTLEIPRKAPHRWVTQKVGESTVTVAYVPQLFHLDPGLPPDDITFLFMPPTWWLDEQEEALRSDFGEQARRVARAAYFVESIAARPCPSSTI